jgi:hypothetical protein
MRAEFKVTDSTDEICFDDLSRGDDVIQIPLFQREYVWTKKQFERLLEDVALVDDAEGDTQFLGAVVAIEQSAAPGQLRHYEVVDGQQRLTTIYLLIAAAATVAARHGHEDYAARLISTVLLVRQLPGTTTNTRLVPCSKDRQRFIDVWKFLMRSSPNLEAKLRDQPSPPPASAAYRADATNASKLYDQFMAADQYCEDRYTHRALEGLESLIKIVMTRLSFIFISLKDPSGAPRIFENLNNAGVKTTVANLARNEIFGRMSDDPGRAFRVFQNEWEPFQGRFGERFDEFFFPYGLTLDPNVKKATLFEQLRRRWANERSPEAIIKSLNTAADWFLWVATDAPAPKAAPAKITAGFKRLRALRAPSSTYPFFMQLAEAVIDRKIAIDEAEKTIAVIESFLVRRAVCGFEPTGLHAVFKGLWRETKGELAAVSKNIQQRSTVPWPDNDAFGKAVQMSDLYHRNIAPYLLTEYEISIGADRPDNKAEIEHVMPQVLSTEWKIDRRVHKKYVDTWANLVAVSPTLNKRLGNDPYEKKRKRYLKESMWASPRRVAQVFPEWNEEALEQRSLELADWALQRWPY